MKNTDKKYHAFFGEFRWVTHDGYNHNFYVSTQGYVALRKETIPWSPEGSSYFIPLKDAPYNRYPLICKSTIDDKFRFIDEK